MDIELISALLKDHSVFVLAELPKVLSKVKGLFPRSVNDPRLADTVGSG